MLQETSQIAQKQKKQIQKNQKISEDQKSHLQERVEFFNSSKTAREHQKVIVVELFNQCHCSIPQHYPQNQNSRRKIILTQDDPILYGQRNLQSIMKVLNCMRANKYINNFYLNSKQIKGHQARAIYLNNEKNIAKLLIKFPYQKMLGKLIIKILNTTMHFNTYIAALITYHPKEQRCWQLRGYIKILNISEKGTYALCLGAIGMNDFLAYQLIKGHVNSEVYQYHLCSLIKKLKQHYEEQQFEIILDNSPIHKSKKVRKLLTAVRNIFLPPYSPQLNPIEKLWHLLKQHISKNIKPCSSDIDKLIHQFFGKFQGQEIEKLIMSMIPSLKLAFHKLFQINLQKKVKSVNLEDVSLVKFKAFTLENLKKQNCYFTFQENQKII